MTPIRQAIVNAVARWGSRIPRGLAGPGRRALRLLNGGRISSGGGTISILYNGVVIEAPEALLTAPVLTSIRDGYYELPEAAALGRILREGDTVFDIGSGLGYIATLARRACADVRVLAFDANPELCAVAERTYAVNQVDVRQFNEVLGPSDGETVFNLHRDFWSSSTISWPGARPITVPMRSFQSRLDEFRPEVLIVDIEGGEQDLFDDADLSCVRVALVEVHPHILAQDVIERVLATLAAKGLSQQTLVPQSTVWIAQRP